MEVLAQGGYRWRAQGLKGLDRCAAKQVFGTFVETAGEVEIPEGRSVVRRDRRSHNPILREAALDQQCPPVSWLNNFPVTFSETGCPKSDNCAIVREFPSVEIRVNQ